MSRERPGLTRGGAVPSLLPSTGVTANDRPALPLGRLSADDAVKATSGGIGPVHLARSDVPGRGGLVTTSDLKQNAERNHQARGQPCAGGESRRTRNAHESSDRRS